MMEFYGWFGTSFRNFVVLTFNMDVAPGVTLGGFVIALFSISLLIFSFVRFAKLSNPPRGYSSEANNGDGE